MSINKLSIHAVWILVFLLSVVSCKKTSVSPDQEKFFLKYYGGASDQYTGDMVLTSDGGYIIVGSTSSMGNGGYDIYLVKIDAHGNEQWSKTYGGSGDDEGRVVRTTSDGGYILLGSLQDQTTGKSNMYLVKISNDGTQQWTKEYGDVAYTEKGTSIEITADGGYVMVGTTDHVDLLKNGGSGPEDLTDIYLVKVSADGTIEWESIYGFNSADEGTGVQQISDDVFASSAYSSGSSAIIKPDGKDMLVVKGRVQGSNSYAPNLYINKSNPIDEMSIENAMAIQYLGGNELVVLGNTSSDMYLLKIDISSGSKIWFKTFGLSGTDQAKNFSITSDGGFIVVGYSETDNGNFKDISLTKLTSEGGSEWTKLFGGDGDDRGFAVKQTNDGGYAVAANVMFGGSGLGANRVMSLIKTNSKGELANE